MWQEIVDEACGLSGQAIQHVLEITVRIVPIEFGGLDEAHDDAGALARAQGPTE